MVSERALDSVDAAVALALVLGLLVLPVRSTMEVGAVALLLAPGVLVATALSRTPRDRVQASLAVAVYVAVLGFAVGAELDGLFEDFAGLLAVVVVVLAVVLAYRCFRRLRDDSASSPVGVGKGRPSAVGAQIGERSSDVIGAVQRDGDGPVVFPNQPRRRAVVLRATAVPFLLVPLGALLLAARVAMADPAQLPAIDDGGIRLLALFALLPALLHGGNVLARAGIARWRDDDGGVERGELHWALAHGVAWGGFWIAGSLDGRALVGLAALAVAGSAIGLAAASVGVIRAATPDRRSSVVD